ncbi:hypothetical protein D8B26_007907 [Coccidioides posadasii str. Silveira]|uniref:Uncharacterized protein n=1 Tax=Coccidioides posadasii (strain RMSCC 757 / Silveira) TaxID=443226 RepID=E9D1P4_COCPS|nr:conserved hypothetical protein [Coccidioides posadasii str. Silveira]QVM13295.1 hypothetical protein D8B26_007907 [Coccidioides posadasii str. Silveira]
MLLFKAKHSRLYPIPLTGKYSPRKEKKKKMAAADTIAPTLPPAFSAYVPSPSSSKPQNGKIKPIVNNSDAVEQSGSVQFDPSVHLNFTAPSKVHTMKELGYKDNVGVSPVGVSEPFPLFSAEAIKQMRKEVLSENVWRHYKFSSNIAQCQLRGFAPEFAPFVYDAWKNPETLAIVSKIAGIDLVPVMDWEIGHINISVQSEEQKNKALADAARKAEEGEGEEQMPIVDWHTDSYPFVCVLMLSDCTNMIGGETALRKGDRSILKVRGPQMGCAVVLQGRYIEHVALRALGSTERITMVTSFRPRSATLPDDTVLTTVRAISDLPELYFQFSEYRLEILEERIRKKLKEIRDQKRARRPFNTQSLKRFLLEQEQFLAHMNKEMVDEDKVTVGFTDDSHLLSEDLKERSRKRARPTIE